MTRKLPVAAPGRWKPLRAGLVDLFYYDSEEFWFRDGRLLLRGNNGTGKSKVLALMLPFLLDGDLSPYRVEPDADPKKRMEWNLLLGGAHPHPERLGYTWLEFGRVDDDGTRRYRTLGCGLKAVAGRGISRHWYFVTSRRVGDDLTLFDPTGTALSRDRLDDALGDRGTVYERARDYRRAVDECLFGFGEQRYGALVELLIQLRQPQLSKRPSEKALSDALTEALPPLDPAVVADVAEAFRSLEDDRDALRAMTDARDAATSFLSHYRRYARIAARRRTRLPREAQASYERTNRELVAAQAGYDAADEQLTAARATVDELRVQDSRLRARDEALRASPEMRSATELERVAAEARRLSIDARQAEDDRDAAARLAGERRERHTAADARLSAARTVLAGSRQSAAEAAAGARISADHTARVDLPLDDLPDLDVVRRAAGETANRQQRAVTHVASLLDAAEEAAGKVAAARARLAELDADAAEMAGRRADADEAVRDSGRELTASVRGHLDRATELRLPDPATTFAELELWVETLEGPNPAAAAVGAAGQSAATRLARADAELENRQSSIQARCDELDAEIARLERGEDSSPPAPHTRGSRGDRVGAPLWQLVDFADHVGADDRAGLEAALEAAGILDAWVTPDGALLDAGTDDVVLRAGEPVPVSLAGVLRPAVDREDARAAAVPDATVAGMLAAIGLGEHSRTWVAPDGRFRNGVLRGAWRKPVAKYIGRGARDAARRARLAELGAELAALRAELAGITTERARLGERTATLSAEVAGLPGDAALRQAHAAAASLATEQARLQGRRDTAAQGELAAVAAEEGARAALEETAHDTGLPADRAALADVRAALGRYREVLAGLWPAVDAVRDAVRQAGETAADLAQTEEAAGTLAERAAEAEQQAVAADERHEALRGTVGAAVADLQRRLEQVAEQKRANDVARAEAAHAAERALEARGKAEGRKEELTGQLQGVAEERTQAAEAFRRFVGTGLLAVALPELEVPDPGTSWSPDPTVRLARKVNDELAETVYDDSAWDRAQHRVNNELKTLHDTLSRHGNRASADLREDGVVVEVEFQGRPATVPELQEALESDVADRERLLNEREREILENHLVNEVASTLQELISAAEAQVAAMNDELDARPTSTGMRLRLQWRPHEDGPAGLTAARERLLRQTSDAWSPDDQAAVGEFLQAQIAEVRARNATGTWLEHLTEALDYRRWNRFVIQRHQNGQWRPATGPASGGERVLAASVPLFAAASSHYASAGSPHAPRLVTLDEAFAGVDDNARAKYLGLLAAFDLDVVMTSEREWGCYPEVPGLAISQLARTEDVAAVLVTNWEWDGATRQRVQRDIRTVVPEPAEPPPQDGLWT